METIKGLVGSSSSSSSSSSGGGPIAVLLDTSVGEQKGGSGVSFDWGVAQRLQSGGWPVVVAGGLKPANVSEAVRQVCPFGVDVSGGVEGEGGPGLKDGDKVKEFIRSVRGVGILG